MTLQICSYQGCYIQRFPFSSITFFQLPIDEPRRTQWIVNSGNKQLLNLKTNQKRYFCENHFQKTDIKPHFYRKILYKNAVPVPYLSEDVPTTTTSTTTSDANFTEFDEVEEVINEAEAKHISDCCQLNEISEREYGDDAVEDLNVSQTDCYIMNDYDDMEYIEENNIIQGETQILKEILSDEETKADSEQIVPIERISVDDDDLDTSSIITVAAAIVDSETINEIGTTIPVEAISIGVDALASSSIVAAASSSTGTTDAIIETAPEVQGDAAATTALVTNGFKEIQNDFCTSDKSYESDKHFALSLVYYFQRLNAKKKTKAKIDILTYLVALEQDNDS